VAPLQDSGTTCCLDVAPSLVLLRAAVAACLKVREGEARFMFASPASSFGSILVERDRANAREPVAAFAGNTKKAFAPAIHWDAAPPRTGERQPAARRRYAAPIGAAAREKLRRLPEVARDTVTALVASCEIDVGVARSAVGAGAARCCRKDSQRCRRNSRAGQASSTNMERSCGCAVPYLHGFDAT